jgi:UDPglucose--hexose-1-phosphate uridylyltransferase
MDAMKMKQLFDGPHGRFNPLTGEWILVSPHRLKRPWQGKVEEVPPEVLPAYDPVCYLCPGNTRAAGVVNPAYESTFVFQNDFAALLPEIAPGKFHSGLLVARAERGVCRVICFSPRHDLTLSRMPTGEIRNVVDVWAEQYEELGALEHVRHVQIFENRGQVMGCSNPHPHCQVWATETLPVEPEKEDRCLAGHFQANGRSLIADYVAAEVDAQERVVCGNDTWIAVVPFWAKWPFETLVAPLRHVPSMQGLEAAERDGLADILRRLTTRYDNLFRISFPYTMGFHQAPTDGGKHEHWHLHAHFYPPLLRSATVQKFMVGFEMLSTPQRDITPEQAAERLRSQPELHLQSVPGGGAVQQ